MVLSHSITVYVYTLCDNIISLEKVLEPACQIDFAYGYRAEYGPINGYKSHTKEACTGIFFIFARSILELFFHFWFIGSWGGETES